MTPLMTLRAKPSTNRPNCFGLAYPGGPLLAKLAESGDTAAFAIPRPLLHFGRPQFQLCRAQDSRNNEVTPDRHRIAGPWCSVGAANAAASRPSAARGSRRERAGRDRGLLVSKSLAGHDRQDSSRSWWLVAWGQRAAA